ncbi:hypothetical protein AAGG74_15215 [Bacillus mexicanus]|uniref:hypothetical protein n=1 Tax=Bacillus mexicanus TaxID=2834415 RepID=UPI003D20AD18
MDNRETEIIQQAEKFIRKTASMIGHKNANNLLEVVKLAKKQSIELSLYSDEYRESANERSDLICENEELKKFKDATEEVVGDIILDLIEDRIADK